MFPIYRFRLEDKADIARDHGGGRQRPDMRPRGRRTARPRRGRPREAPLRRDSRSRQHHRRGSRWYAQHLPDEGRQDPDVRLQRRGSPWQKYLRGGLRNYSGIRGAARSCYSSDGWGFAQRGSSGRWSSFLVGFL